MYFSSEPMAYGMAVTVAGMRCVLSVGVGGGIQLCLGYKSPGIPTSLPSLRSPVFAFLLNFNFP